VAKAKLNVAVGIAKCPNTKKVYGVRMEERHGKIVATWAFPIRPETARKEGYKEDAFPAGIAYDPKYPVCPYCGKKEDLAAISASLAQKKATRIMVGTNSSYDDLGKVLSSMKIKWSPLGDLKNCDILFLNCCGSAPSEADLRKFVSDGGCVFGSCTQKRILESAFPESIQFADIGYETGTETVTIEDSELKGIAGKKMDIHFHVAGAGNPCRGNFKPILKGTGKLFANGTNVCFRATYGKGAIFFTMFHNSDNINEQEQALLQLLVLKEVGRSQNLSLADTSAELGIDLNEFKRKFRTNF
jgi:hypothetical protein